LGSFDDNEGDRWHSSVKLQKRKR